MSDLDSADSPELDRDLPIDALHDDAQCESSTDLTGLDQPLPAKRKGGRKPIYATSEERKQRNRQAQAAFRERRTEYIKQLEASVKQHDDVTEDLRRRNAAVVEECATLKFRSSLLEQILAEHSIDYRSEMQARGHPAMVDLSAQHMRHLSSVEARHPSKIHSINGLAPKSTNSATHTPIQPTSRLSMASHTSSAPSPSAFTFPNLSPNLAEVAHMNSAEASRRTSSQASDISFRQSQAHHPTMTSSMSSYDRRDSGSGSGSTDTGQSPDYSSVGSYDYVQGLQQGHPRYPAHYLAQHRVHQDTHNYQNASDPSYIKTEAVAPISAPNQMPSGFAPYPFDEMRQAAQRRAWMRQQNGDRAELAPFFTAQ